MNSQRLKDWLHGYHELSGISKLSEAQVKMIKEHLELVNDDDSFISYLKGFLDSVGSNKLSQSQCDKIATKLDSEYDKVTPNLNDFMPKSGWNTNGNMDICNSGDTQKLC